MTPKLALVTDGAGFIASNGFVVHNNDAVDLNGD